MLNLPMKMLEFNFLFDIIMVDTQSIHQSDIFMHV